VTPTLLERIVPVRRLTGPGRLLQLDLSEVDFRRRGFHLGDPSARERLELAGYNAALAHSDVTALQTALDLVDAGHRGFAFEGAAMASSLLDRLLPWSSGRWRRLLDGPGAAHVYMLHVGLGWALARLRAGLPGPLAGLDPVVGWLAADGYGFHETYFRWQATVSRQAVAPRVRGYARQVFDQGVGRGLWFVECADAERLAATISGFPEERRPDLWSGVGLAAAYAGGGGAGDLARLRDAAGGSAPALAQGAAFAAKARARAGNQTPYTETACQVICGVPADAAALVTDEALAAANGDGAPRYERWRQLIQTRFRQMEVMRP
jgi:hypothetical protein